jgi:general secretion pathway protein E
MKAPLELRRLIEWLGEDGVISPVEAKRTIARCAQAESRQAPWCVWPAWR